MRAFGTEISRNQRPGGELLKETRAAIIYALATGKSPTKIATEFRVSRRVVYNTKNRWITTKTLETRPRTGRLSKVSQSTARYIYWTVRRFPMLSWRALAAGTPDSLSISTIKRVLKRYHIRKWKLKKRIPLLKESAKNRYKFAKLWWKYKLWKRWTFSDECSVQRKASHGAQFVFRYQKEGFREDLVNLEVHGKPISQMVWASIWRGGRSKLVVMERDPEAKKQGYSANSYIWALEEGLIENYKPGFIFQQDNARIHTAEKTQEWFESHGIWVVEWPPHSPDLNPIEHVWNMLKRTLLKLHPFLFEEGRAQTDWKNFHEAIQEAWWAIPQASIDRLIDSMPRWIEAVIRARGCYTKY
jgi:transposase